MHARVGVEDELEDGVAGVVEQTDGRVEGQTDADRVRPVQSVGHPQLRHLHPVTRHDLQEPVIRPSGHSAATAAVHFLPFHLPLPSTAPTNLRPLPFPFIFGPFLLSLLPSPLCSFLSLLFTLPFRHLPFSAPHPFSCHVHSPSPLVSSNSSSLPLPFFVLSYYLAPLRFRLLPIFVPGMDAVTYGTLPVLQAAAWRCLQFLVLNYFYMCYNYGRQINLVIGLALIDILTQHTSRWPISQ